MHIDLISGLIAKQMLIVFSSKLENTHFKEESIYIQMHICELVIHRGRQNPSLLIFC